ncbi:MAG: peptide chain release factor 2 [Candidatus Magasanikbacteria bacterium]|jgi:peptide chain release factor 2|nr:peptide chain release factor 2 [Candidatus Magasanikbacteria bacterium]
MHDMKTHIEKAKKELAELFIVLCIEAKRTTLQELNAALQQPDVWNDPQKATVLGKKTSALQQIISDWEGLEHLVQDMEDTLTLMDSSPDDALAGQLQKNSEILEEGVNTLSVFALYKGKYDDSTAIVTFQAGAGGTEAQDWAEMLMRMVLRYAEKKEWTATLLDESRGTEAGIKSATFRIEGSYAFGNLKSEHGTHRLVRISPFDAENMRHTSFANIEVLPEIEKIDIEIDPKELRIDTFMSSGKGGQSVNTTYSAVRIVHIPTGIMVQCQNERSQIQNKDTAMKVLASKLQVLQEEKEQQQRAALKGEHKGAQWGNQIRSYVLHPYKMVKDVRTKFESKDPDAVLDGDLQPFIDAYLRFKASE